jgi:hypothetical protein
VLVEQRERREKTVVLPLRELFRRQRTHERVSSLTRILSRATPADE